MNKLILLFIVLMVAGCKEKFVSPVPPVDTGYLVIEGVINNGGSTEITLSRTTNLSDTSKKYETGATIQLEDSRNNSIPIFESTFGHYSLGNIQLDTTLTYQLTIHTANSEVYQSDFIPIKNN